MKDCELCGLRARMHCESDQASLCWDCDEKVHGANFLVAKHTRSLLCHVCHSPTPWKASGAKLTPIVSVCENCVDCHGRRFEQGRDDESQGGNDDEEEEEDDDDEDEDEIDVLSVYDDDGDFDDEDEDGENQVVPWSFSFSSSTPPPLSAAASLSTTSEEERLNSVSKQTRENADLDYDDEATSSASFRSAKRPRLAEDYGSMRTQDDDGQTESSRSTAIISSLQRLTKDAITDVDDASATILGICKLSKDQSR